jgi:hypothetical protein
MTYDAIFQCAVALLRGRTLQSGPTRVKPSPHVDAYDQAAAFVQTVGPNKALQAALGKKKKGIKWI